MSSSSPTLRFRCDCGRPLTAPESAAGRRGRCPACGTVFTVPAPAAEVAPVPVIPVETDGPSAWPAPPSPAGGYALAEELAPPVRRGTVFRPSPPPIPARTPAVPDGDDDDDDNAPLAPAAAGRPYRYLFLLLALIPLIYSTVQPQPRQTWEDRAQQTAEHHPEVADRYNQLVDDDRHITKAEVLAALLGDRCEGALFAYDTYAHWGLAAASAAGFVGVVLVLFPPGHTRVVHLLAVGAFTGTGGILLLLGLQFAAFHMPLFTGGSVITILLDLVWLIGLSYRMALGDHGILLSALGFTAGVGFCEEACKAIPLLFKVRGPTGNGGGFVSWRSAMLWGLISGVGFGVSEGITYASDYYNGVLGGQVYAVRFVSCVALHAIWAAAVGIAIYRRRAHFVGHLNAFEWIGQTLMVVLVPMCLHGLYDTLLKQDHDVAALLVALGSFGWLAWQVELAKRQLDRVSAAAGRGFQVVPAR